MFWRHGCKLPRGCRLAWMIVWFREPPALLKWVVVGDAEGRCGGCYGEATPGSVYFKEVIFWLMLLVYQHHLGLSLTCLWCLSCLVRYSMHKWSSPFGLLGFLIIYWSVFTWFSARYELANLFKWHCYVRILRNRYAKLLVLMSFFAVFWAVRWNFINLTVAKSCFLIGRLFIRWRRNSYDLWIWSTDCSFLRWTIISGGALNILLTCFCFGLWHSSVLTGDPVGFIFQLGFQILYALVRDLR